MAEDLPPTDVRRLLRGYSDARRNAQSVGYRQRNMLPDPSDALSGTGRLPDPSARRSGDAASSRHRSEAAQTARYQGLADAHTSGGSGGLAPSSTPPPPASSGPSGGGYSPALVGGSGGGASADLAAAESSIEKARQRAQEAQDRLEGQFQKDRDELREQFEFAETPAERDMLARAMGELERQREHGEQAIYRGFARAQASVSERILGMQDSAADDAAAMTALFTDAAGRVGEQAAVADQASAVEGLGVNQDGGTAAAAGIQAALHADGAAQGALEQRLGDIRVEDAGWMRDQMGGEQAAHQGQLQRDVAGLIAATQSEHDARVQQRIAQERAQWAQQLGQMQGAFRDRGLQLDMTDIGLLETLAQQQHQSAEAAADRALQVQMANAQAQNAARAAAARSSAGGGGGMPPLDSMEGLMFGADVLNQYGPDVATAILGSDMVNRLTGGGIPGAGTSPTGGGYSGGSLWDPLQNTPRGR